MLATTLCAPPILQRINKEQYIAIDETIGNALKLRFGLRCIGKAPVGIEVVVVIQALTVIVITVSRHKSHLVQCRTHRTFEPLLPLPLGVSITSCIGEVSGEQTELSVRLVLGNCLCTLASLINILIVLYMAIGHIDEREITLFSRFGHELGYLAPILPITDTPTIYRSRLQGSSLCLMTHVVKLRVTRQTRCCTDIVLRTLRCLDRRVMQRSVRRLSTYFNNSVRFGKVLCRSISHRYQLYHTVVDSAVRKPAETHMGSRITIDSSDLVVRILFNLQFADLLLHGCNFLGNSRQQINIIRLHTINLSYFFCYQIRNETRNRVVLDMVRSLSLYYLMRIFHRRLRSNHYRSCCTKTTFLSRNPRSSRTRRYTGNLTILNRCNRRIVNRPGDAFIVRISRLYLGYQRTRFAFDNLDGNRSDTYARNGNHRGVRIILISSNIYAGTFRTRYSYNIRCRSLSCIAVIQQLSRSIGQREVRISYCHSLRIGCRYTRKTRRATEIRTIRCIIIRIQTKRNTRSCVRFTISTFTTCDVVHILCIRCRIAPEDRVHYRSLYAATGITAIDTRVIGYRTVNESTFTIETSVLGRMVVIYHAVADDRTGP